MVNIIKMYNHLWPQTIDSKKKNQKKIATCNIENSVLDWGHTQNYVGFKLVNEIQDLPLLINKGNNKITELRTILQRESQNS